MAASTPLARNPAPRAGPRPPLSYRSRGPGKHARALRRVIEEGDQIVSIQTVISGEGQSGVASAFKVDVTRGSRDARVSSQWFSRPDDERFLSLGELYASVRGRADRSETSTV